MQNNDQALQDAIRFAQSPAGQQLLHLLQENGGTELQAAMEKAASGNFLQAKQSLSALMNMPEVKKLMEQLGRE